MLAWLLAKIFSSKTLAEALSKKKDVMSVSLLTAEMIQDMHKGFGAKIYQEENHQDHATFH